MKTNEIESWININRMTPGRRGFVARKIKTAAGEHGCVTLEPMCDAIIVQETEQLALIRRYRAARAQQETGRWSPEILEQDAAVDRLVSELRALLTVLAKREATARGQAAKALLDAHFAQGVAYYTQVGFEQQSERVGELLQALAAAGEQVATATVDDVVADLTVAHAHFAQLLTAFEKPERIEYNTVKEVDLANQRALLELISEIFAATRAFEPQARSNAREALLDDLSQHDAAISKAVRARRRIRDVHPETGEPQEDAIADGAATG